MGIESYLRAVTFAVVTAVASVEDCRRRCIPDALIGIGFISAIVLGRPLYPALAGCALGLSVFLLVRFLCRGRLGLGDVKLAGYLGAVLGPRLWWVTVVIASLAALMVLAVRTRMDCTRYDVSLPFAPFLTAAALLSLTIERVAPAFLTAAST